MISARLVGAVFGLVLVASPVLVASQVQTSREERFFRIEWQVEHRGGRAPAIVGTVKNDYAHPIQRVQVHVRILDAAGQMVHETFGTTRDVPAGGRGEFRVPLPRTGDRYVLTVHSFEFGAGQSP